MARSCYSVAPSRAKYVVAEWRSPWNVKSSICAALQAAVNGLS
jgi:hypothetical protein